MYVVIGGAGDAGLHLGRLLRAEGHEVAFIDKESSAAAAASEIDALVVKGNVCDPSSLMEAGIAQSDFYVGLVSEDSSNLISCSLANYHGAGTIAGIKDPTLAFEAISRRYAHIGVDIVLCPPLIAAYHISRVFSFPSKLREIRRRGIEIYHMVIEDKSRCCRKPISQFDLPQGVKIVSVFRGLEQILPTEDLTLQAEDELCILAEDLANVKSISNALWGKVNPYREVKNVFIAGATNTGLTLAEKLLGSNISVVLMDMSKKRTERGAERIPRASIIHSDPLGQGVLKKEEIGRFDVLMAMGIGMERNILISVLAKQFGVPNALAMVDRIDLKTSVERTLVDDVVVPNLLLVKTIMNLLKGGEPLRKKYLQKEEITLREIKVSSKMRGLGKTVGDFCSTIGSLLVAGIVNEKKAIVPSDDHVISEGERLFLLYYPSNQRAVDRWV